MKRFQPFSNILFGFPYIFFVCVNGNTLREADVAPIALIYSLSLTCLVFIFAFHIYFRIMTGDSEH